MKGICFIRIVVEIESKSDVFLFECLIGYVSLKNLPFKREL